MKKIKSRKHGQKSMAMKRLRVKKKKIMNIRSNLAVLNHISKKNCALLPYLDDESLHTLGEFIFNVITMRVKLDNSQLKKVQRILKKDKHFYAKLIGVKYPLRYFKQTLRLNSQIGNGIVSIIAALAPLISSLIYGGMR